MDMHQQGEDSKRNAEPAKLDGSFVPPRHWIGPEELEASYWNDPKIQEKRGQEFYEKPVEFVEKIDKMDKEGIVRRDFLTVMGASMAMASFACARRPVQKIIPYVVKPEEITPGVANWYASTCQECSSGCGTLVKTREGRPIKLEGNPEHPMNKGALCAKGQSSVLSLYDPDRLKNPVARGRKDGSQRDVSWNDVDSYISGKLKSVMAKSGQIRVLTGEVSGDSTRRLVREFLAAAGMPATAHVEYEALGLEEISEAQRLSYGTAVTPRYFFEKADFILSLGADFIGTWLSPVEHSQAWSKNRKLQNQNPAQAKLSKLVTFEPTLTITGSNSDERYPVRPGDELKIAMAVAHVLIMVDGRSALARDTAVAAILQTYSPEKVAAEIGLEGGATVIKKLAHDLWENRGKSLVIGGGIQSKTSHAVSLQIAVNLLNSVLGNEGVTVDGTAEIGFPQKGFSGLAQLIAEMKAGKIQTLIIQGTNPAYTLPANTGFQEALKNVPTVIMVSERVDETGLLADFVLAEHHSLENWGDANPRKGLYSLQQPTISPIHTTRSFQDNLLTWAKALGTAKSGLISQAPDWHEYLRGNWRETLYKSSGAVGTFEVFWEGVLRAGVFETSKGSPTARNLKTDSVKTIPPYSAANNDLLLTLYPKVSMGDGRSGNNAWLQEMPDPISSVTWDNYLNVGPALAKKLGLGADDVVEVKTGDVSAQLPVHIQPGMHPQAISAAVGYGRRSVGKVGNKAGVDVYPFIKSKDGALAFSGTSVTVRRMGSYYRLASTQWHTASENRPIINDITLKQFKHNPAAAMHTDPHLRLETVPTLWPKHEYKSYRWGMAIDLNSCTGCGACVLACQAENNVPVVGRDQVRVSRQMHWIRIDRYYSGNPESPDVIFQPMLCQHCENAPCETVCPVVATVHDDEGLNLQVYNRCVGTRYCQNNCPYKVRRFNFFDHWKAYSGTMNMVWNPDVTVRTRGIMEKCTFCTQRIRDAKDKAKDAGERVKDGDFKTACQQTCPTEAIIFGDMNDPQSRVSKMADAPQAFRSLEVLNAKPAISYMTKVRNKDAVGGAEHV